VETHHPAIPRTGKLRSKMLRDGVRWRAEEVSGNSRSTVRDDARSQGGSMKKQLSEKWSKIREANPNASAAAWQGVEDAWRSFKENLDSKLPEWRELDKQYRRKFIEGAIIPLVVKVGKCTPELLPFVAVFQEMAINLEDT
jgi:ferric-dicitrate binding protein FerR (iron transport regulator)